MIFLFKLNYMLYKEVIITSGTKTFKVLSLENGQYKRQREM